MAIQVGGTTVIDNSRTLQNVGGLKTINSTSILGSGNISAGASTTYGDVGTYVWGRRAGSNQSQAQFIAGSTYAGSTLYPAGLSGTVGYPALDYAQTQSLMIGMSTSPALSGTWRAMGTTAIYALENPNTLFVRIS